MRASGRDIIELFGFSPDDTSKSAVDTFKGAECPFTGSACTKTNHDQTVVYGTCSVSSGINKGVGSEIIICPKRLYAEKYAIFNHVLESAWTGQRKTLVIGGTLKQLQDKARKVLNPVIAFGQGSGKEVHINSNGSLSMDWVLQSYRVDGEKLIPTDFVGLEVQSIDITGNYRDNWAAYKKIKEGKSIKSVPNSGHGLNWANVHKRLIPQIIRKGNVYSKIKRCVGFYFIVPDGVYQRFEEVVGEVPTVTTSSNQNLSVITFRLGKVASAGQKRQLELVRQVVYPLKDVAEAFIANTSVGAPAELDAYLNSLLT